MGLSIRDCTLTTAEEIKPVNTTGINKNIIKTVFLCLSEQFPKVEKKFLKEIMAQDLIISVDSSLVIITIYLLCLIYS